MPDQKIIDYINSQLAAGFDRNKIRNDLLTNGSLPTEIDLAFNSLNIPPQNIPSLVGSPTSVFPASQSSNSIFKKVLSVVSILIIVGGFSAAAYYGFNYYKSSQITLGKAIINTVDAFSKNKIRSGEFSISIGVTANDVGKNYSDLVTNQTSKQITGQLQDVSFSFVYSGIVNKIGDDKFETSGDLSASIKNPNGSSLGMFGPQELSLEYKTFSDNIYLNIKSIPSIVFTMIPITIDTTKYLNQWFFMPTNMTDQYTKNSIGATTTLSETSKKQILSLFDQSGAFTITDRNSEKTEKGTAVTAMYIKIDWDKLADEIVRLGKENDKTYTKAQELELRTNIEKVKELPVSNSIFKVLVGDDGYIHGYFSSGDLVDKNNSKIGDFRLDFTADNFNQNFIINRPTNARDFKEAMAEINSLMSGSNSRFRK